MRMLEKEFVPYDLALKLKELGFDKESLGFYNIDGELMCRSTLKRTNSEVQGVVIAPLWQQAFEFFRENDLYAHIGTGSKGNSWDICNSHLDLWGDRGFKSYEEAQESCMRKLINLIAND